ncbi:glycosyltransferase family 39 protein [Candidatus Falkowbacteria bacterium]|nr:glycosyltransferase family 39 protein [Candidatus Falkowbacteria bacterium]
MKKRYLFSLFFLAIVFQFFYSLYYPANQPDNPCQLGSEYFLVKDLEKIKNEYNASSGDLSKTDKFFKTFPDYRVICDSMSYVLQSRNWPESYKERSLYVDHPLYDIFATLILSPYRLFVGVPSYAIVFGSLIAANLLMLFAAVWFFYELTARFFSNKVAATSSLLLIFSPFVHTMVTQPTSSGMMEIFVVAASLWLFFDYAKKPSWRKLAVNSLLFGSLMLGKQIFALSLFFIIIALKHKKIKEAAAFMFLQLVPTALWAIYVKLVLGVSFYSANVTGYEQGSWFLKVKYWELYKMSNIVLSALPNFTITLLFGFLVVPVVLSVYGVYKMEDKKKAFYYWTFLLSFLALFFAMKYYRPSLSFLVYPAIYPTAVLGLAEVRRLAAKRSELAGKVIYYGILIALIFFSSLNVYKLGVWDLVL